MRGKKYVTIAISKTFILGLTLVILGGLFAWNSKTNAEGIMERTVPARKLSLLSMEEGAYIKGYVRDIAGYLPVNKEEWERSLNFWEKMFYLPGIHYKIYLLPIGGAGREYVAVSIDRELSELLEQPGNERRTFTGKVVSSSNEKRYERLEEVMGTKDKAVIDRSVSSLYAIRLLDLEKEQLHIKEGLAVLASGFLLLILSLVKR